MHSQGGMRALWVPVQELPGTPSLTLGRGVGEGEQGLLGSGLGAGAGRQVGKRGRVWGQAPTSWSPRQAPSLSWGGQEQGLEGR